ncbi:ester cyclase [Mycobacterium barrassiae]|uniref:ester cyclase n=1 Tax=Mycobacterium barrassiae TaxID=319709 RepID=UPI00226583D7|nr:ester cyclase [Mycobacterium barrassiae]
MLTDDQFVACRLYFRCTPQRPFLGFEPTGAQVSFAEHVFYRFDKQRIVEVWSLIDTQAVREQLARP